MTLSKSPTLSVPQLPLSPRSIVRLNTLKILRCSVSTVMGIHIGTERGGERNGETEEEVVQVVPIICIGKRLIY